MRRPLVLCVIVVLALTSAAAPSALGQATPPRGILTGAEYLELLATQQSVNRRGQLGTPTSIAHRDCAGLTGITRLTATQHAECVASLLFFYHFVQFAPALARCDRTLATPRRLRCIRSTSHDLYRFTSGFIQTDAASVRAARQRGLTGQCLGYLVFTTPQSKAMHGLEAGLQRLSRTIRGANQDRIASASRRLVAALTVTGEAFNTVGTVTVCPHQ